ncbi:Kdo hydroxylase family protein [Myxococcus sp. K15C18031901]|uniref:Kdo hydroxylase family protein n=1 Tax=Myxococcus dinghuensis TaxID=2906761 RepID=UPI0020A83645|nr:Kdo hydroxylase family protein [Myxococcus dinghuensis]MCP3103688.1 Kdo hydroxylase family protein [Myxococcus dinghuensis]
MLETFDAARVKSAGATALSDALEQGRIVYFPESPVALPTPGDAAFLREELPALLKRKNVSYYPDAQRLVGLASEGAHAERTHHILREHSQRVTEFLTRAMPLFVKDWSVGTSSFRPLQEKGRRLEAHASNELIHVDAGAYGATHGDRILRFFINLHPTEERRWATRGTFEALYSQYGATAGVAPEPGVERSLHPGLAGRLYSGMLQGASRLGVRMARVVDTSPYDRLMRRFHNFMKDTPEFQASRDGYQEFGFPPASAWMVLTDGVSHACLSGQYALVDTFLIRLSSCRHAQSAPYHLLRRAPTAAPTRAAA